MTIEPRLWTVSRIAEHLGVSRTRVEWILRTRDIAHSDRVGIVRIYTTDAVERIESEVRKIDNGRQGVTA